MDCREAQSLFSEHIDGRAAERKALLEAHLKDCAACRDGFQELLDAHEAVGGAYRFKAPAGFAAGIMGKIASDEQTGEDYGQGSGKPWHQKPFSISANLGRFAIIMVLAIEIISGAFFAGKFFIEKDISTADSEQIFASMSLDYLGAAPPESIAGAYFDEGEYR
ncbi:MAG: zf-HC2 domain-containing protein [Deltaproteobacteria bacterium]|nr:zf-HC2 domain-containing protein [Deltaproteobacteria bacterium]